MHIIFVNRNRMMIWGEEGDEMEDGERFALKWSYKMCKFLWHFESMWKRFHLLIVAKDANCVFSH